MRHIFFLAACVLASACPAHADTLHFTYAGANFDRVVSDGTLPKSYSTADRITGYIDVSVDHSSLTLPNQSFVANTVLGFSFSDGVQALDSSNATLDFDFSTSAPGTVTYFDLFANSLSAPYQAFIEAGHYQFTNSSLAETNLANYGENHSSGSLGYSVTSLGAITPEPSTFALLGTGVLGIAGVLRKRLF